MVAVFENNGNIDIPVPQILMESVSNAAVGVTTLKYYRLVYSRWYLKFRRSILDNLRPGGVVTKKNSIALYRLQTQGVQTLNIR